MIQQEWLTKEWDTPISNNALTLILLIKIIPTMIYRHPRWNIGTSWVIFTVGTLEFCETLECTSTKWESISTQVRVLVLTCMQTVYWGGNIETINAFLSQSPLFLLATREKLLSFLLLHLFPLPLLWAFTSTLFSLFESSISTQAWIWSKRSEGRVLREPNSRSKDWI